MADQARIELVRTTRKACPQTLLPGGSHWPRAPGHPATALATHVHVLRLHNKGCSILTRQLNAKSRDR